MMANFTPGMAVPDMSPVKEDESNRGVMSSSPPPMDHGMGSPTKSKGMRSSLPPSSSAMKGAVKEEPAKVNGMVGANANANGDSNVANVKSAAPPSQAKDDDDEDGIGFDLARGFAPIGASRSFSGGQQGAAAARAN
jgi:forkhead protein FKH